MTRATNDNFLHLTLAQQSLLGDWPVRDFFDQGWVLQYTLSAAAQILFGQRLGSEAVVVGLAWAVSTYLTFVEVRRLTRSPGVAGVSALLLIVASARGYSYPKGIVYAVAAWLWWRYVTQPTLRGCLLFGAWTAVAFYWRPDHGVYVALAVVLAAMSAHGIRPLALRRCATAGAVALACVAPFLLYVQWAYGLRWYVQTGLVQGEAEHQSHGTHEWPLIRYSSKLVHIESADSYAPTVGLRWQADSSNEQRQQIRARYGLTHVADEAGGVERVRLSAGAIPQIRALINEPLIDDTAGIDRSAGLLAERDWPRTQQWKFNYAWMRVRLLPFLNREDRASELVAALLLGFPLVLLAGAPWIARRLDVPGAGPVAAFAVFAFVVAWAMIRNPFAARVADAIVLSSICFGCCLGAVWQRAGTGWLYRIVRLGAGVAAAAVVLIVAQAGRFESPLRWADGSREAFRELSASPPLDFYVDRPARFTLRLAAYVRDCVPADDRLLVLWFEPEIYYYSERLMAQRHLVFAPAWAALEHEQRVTLDKIDRFRPPLVLARRSALDEYARATYPGVISYVERNYVLASTAHDSDEEYLIFARRDRPVVRSFREQAWPCYTPEPSRWSRVGSRDR